MHNARLKGLSLFANVGIAETYFEETGIDIVIANEIEEKRAKLYRYLYPKTDLIVGDIVDDNIRNQIVDKAKKQGVEFLIATPPCQGMSLAGSRDPLDERNQLIYYTIDVIKRLKPKYILLENVPQMLKTKININEKTFYIPEYIEFELNRDYNFADKNLISAMDYEVPQMRKRSIYLLSRKDQDYHWQVPEPKERITIRDVLSDLPSVDPILKEGIDETIKLFPNFEEKKKMALEVSKFHRPPKHSKKHVITMMNTPTGQTAFDNKFYYPKRDDGERVKGHSNQYRRFEWDKPARTITQNNGVISSLCCVHPGRCYNDEKYGTVYSEPRVLTLYELFIVFSLPKNWNLPEWADERFVRSVIGEGIPPKLVQNLISELILNLKGA